MGSFSLWHWLLVLVVILIVFGAGKLPKVAGDLASGIKNFRKGMKEETETPKDGQAAAPASPVIQQQAQPSAAGTASASADKPAQH